MRNDLCNYNSFQVKMVSYGYRKLSNGDNGEPNYLW